MIKWTFYESLSLSLRNRLTDIENRLVVSGGGRTGGMEWEFGSDMYTLLYLKHITNTEKNNTILQIIL